ncbi:MAG: 50S ribosomal protein L6 [Myxococcales bacterium]|nr:50S ribosomal protein L6 [Myxococcales bacterium]USN50903.1 MAG: 50S ribosomal protein L6 [Myxococcales bacterium]
MSRIGKLPISIPEKVDVKIASSRVEVKGPKGTLAFDMPGKITAKVESGSVVVQRNDEDGESRSLHGLCRSQIANMVNGVSVGFTRDLDINGVGYRAEVKGKELHMSLGYSHPVVYPLPEGITAVVDGKRTRITLTGIDKQLLGNTAAKVRSFRPPEPYRGKGVKYAEEIIKRKEGKSAGK